jgi:hypothetical protein
MRDGKGRSIKIFGIRQIKQLFNLIFLVIIKMGVVAIKAWDFFEKINMFKVHFRHIV